MQGVGRKSPTQNSVAQENITHDMPWPQLKSQEAINQSAESSCHRQAGRRAGGKNIPSAEARMTHYEGAQDHTSSAAKLHNQMQGISGEA